MSELQESRIREQAVLMMNRNYYKEYEGELHKYRDDFDSFVFPRDNQELTQYCAFHYQWEDIKVVYSRNKNNEWGYHYIVSKNKRRNR